MQFQFVKITYVLPTKRFTKAYHMISTLIHIRPCTESPQTKHKYNITGGI